MSHMFISHKQHWLSSSNEHKNTRQIYLKDLMLFRGYHAQKKEIDAQHSYVTDTRIWEAVSIIRIPEGTAQCGQHLFQCLNKLLRNQ